MKFPITNQVKYITDTRKREFSAYERTEVNTDVYSQGGSCPFFEVKNLETGKTHIPSPGSYPWTVKNDYVLQPGDVVIETGKFCGKPATPIFYYRKEDAALVGEWIGVNLTPVVNQ